MSKHFFMSSKRSSLMAGAIALASLLLMQCAAPVSPQAPPELRAEAIAEFNIPSLREPPAGFTKFVLANDYPETLPALDDELWAEIDFRLEPERYMRAVLEYAIQDNVEISATHGNIDVDWLVHEDQKWFHAPWMHRGNNPREPIHGLTRERSSRHQELSETQLLHTRNWAVGFYNARGAYTFGQVWQDPLNPAVALTQFVPGTVTIKLLFTDATDDEAPYLASANGLTWNALINNSGTPVPMRLLQFDIAVRDPDADEYTGWVFGTFMFDGTQNKPRYWENLVPVGLQWGNDPGLTTEKYLAGDRPQEGWINPDVAEMMTQRAPYGTLGYHGRVNGPVDNPLSSCLSCHSRSMYLEGDEGPAFHPDLNDLCIRQENASVTGGGNPQTYVRISNCVVTAAKEDHIAQFYRNLKPTEAFLPGYHSLDYSLQMAVGLGTWHEWLTVEDPQYLDQYLNGQAQQAQIMNFGIPLPQKVVEPNMPTLPANQTFQRGDVDE